MIISGIFIQFSGENKFCNGNLEDVWVGMCVSSMISVQGYRKLRRYCDVIIGRRYDGGGGGGGDVGAATVVSGSFSFLLADALLDEVLGCADGVRRSANRHPAVASARSINALLRDLNVRTAKVLDLQQSLTTRAQNGADYVLTNLKFCPNSPYPRG